MSVAEALVVIVGDLPVHALLRQQLLLDDLFGFRVADRCLVEDVEAALQRTGAVATIARVTMGDTSPTAGTVVRVLDDEVRAWRSARQVIFLPLALFFQTPSEIDAVVHKLISVDFETALLHEALAVRKIRVSTLLAAPPQTLLSELQGQAGQELKAAVVDLTSPSGPWRLSRTHSSARAFNSFAEELPYLRKTVNDAEKGQAEHAFLASVPAPLRAFFPQVGEGFSVNGGFAYDVEFLPMLDLGRFMVHGVLADPAVARAVLKEVERFFERAPKRRVSAKDFRSAARGLLVGKLQSRIEELSVWAEYERFEELCVSAHPGGLSVAVTQLVALLEQAIERMSDEELVFSHGDLCASNILFDRLNGRIKLIDPRGAGDSFLPRLYDLAKLSHSFVGAYELIMNGLAHACVDGKRHSVALAFHTSTATTRTTMKNEFRAWLQRNEFDARLVRLAEASLFFSMLPLHRDSIARMFGQFCAGVEALRAAEGMSS